ncbi:MAG: hypothetical protein P8J32_03480, partial [bacterium]|nr:hypothetical protein [bacterium]
NVYNRKVSKQNLDFLANQMRDGKWKFNGDTIVFDENGNLLDGQHRLEAVVLSKREVETNVTFGIDRETFHTIDTGKVRNSADVLSTQGYKNSLVIAAAAKLVMSLESGVKGVASGGLKSTKFDNLDVLNFIKTRADFADVVNEAHKIWQSMPSRFVSGRIFCAMYYMFYKKHTSQARTFMKSVALGIGIESDSSAYHLRNRLIKMHGDKLNRYTVFNKTAIIAKAWNFARKNEKIGRLNFRRDENFPKIL